MEDVVFCPREVFVWEQGFFQAVWFTTVYQMKIEFSIGLVQYHL